MTTKRLYGILDKVLPKNRCYNLRKRRNADYWRVRVWNSKQLDNQGILAPYIEDELYPTHYEISDTIADFKHICELVS